MVIAALLGSHEAPRFPALALDRVCRALADHEREGAVINFAPGQSSFDVWEAMGEPPPALPPSLIGRYGDLNGSLVLREMISRRLSTRLGGRIGPEQVCITNGGSEALMLALHLLLPGGGTLLMPSICYPGYRHLHAFFGAQRRLIPMRADWNVDVGRLARRRDDAPIALLVNSPGNPFGSVLSDDDLDRLDSLDIPMVFDEVYQPLALDHQPVPSAARLAQRHFIVGSFAKSLAVPGLRLGYLISPPQHVEEIISIKALVSVCSSLAAQHVLEHLLERWDALEAAHRTHLRGCLQHFMAACDEHRLPLLTRPRAGLFATVSLRPGPLRHAAAHGEALAAMAVRGQDADISLPIALSLAKQYGIGTVPSVDFQDRGPAFLRLNFAIPRPQVEPGLARLKRALDALGVTR